MQRFMGKKGSVFTGNRMSKCAQVGTEIIWEMVEKLVLFGWGYMWSWGHRMGEEEASPQGLALDCRGEGKKQNKIKQTKIIFSHCIIFPFLGIFRD